MVSTVKSQLDTGFHFIDALKNAFPPGSMTGAPKIRAMEIIEDLESTKRGAFSGSLGYLSPEGDFDFNVIIRSILYNKKAQYLSFITGGAITANSIAQKLFLKLCVYNFFLQFAWVYNIYFDWLIF
jgi:para-aminobenzoate synthetase component 1